MARDVFPQETRGYTSIAKPFRLRMCNPLFLAFREVGYDRPSLNPSEKTFSHEILRIKQRMQDSIQANKDAPRYVMQGFFFWGGGGGGRNDVTLATVH